MTTPWPDPPAQLQTEPGWAHVFFLDLDLPAARLDALAALLSSDETARARRFRSPRDGQTFTAAHGQMRQVLSAYLGTPPAELHFAANAYGKPSLDPPSSLAFNLSHSGSAALLAVTFGQEVGVDLERFNRPVDLANIARRFFSPVRGRCAAGPSRSRPDPGLLPLLDTERGLHQSPRAWASPSRSTAFRSPWPPPTHLS